MTSEKAYRGNALSNCAPGMRMDQYSPGTYTVEAEAIRPDAAVVAQHLLGFPPRPRGRLAVVGVPAASADGQALQQPPRAFHGLPFAPTVFRQLRLGRLEHGGGDQGGDRDLDPVLPGHGDPGAPTAARLQVAADRAQLQRSRHVAVVAVDGAPDVGRVQQHAADRRGVPVCRPTARRAAGLLQAAADLAQADPLQPDPGEDQPDSPSMRLLRHYVEARDAAARALGDVAVAVGSRGEGAEQA